MLFHVSAGGGSKVVLEDDTFSRLDVVVSLF